MVSDEDTRDEAQDQVRRLLDWAERVTEALELAEPLSADDVDRVLGLAGIAAHGVERPAAPLTTFLVGLAMGADPRLEMPDAVDRVKALLDPPD